MKPGLSRLAVIFIVTVLLGVIFGMVCQISGLFSTTEDETSSIIANLNFILNVGEPIYIEKLEFESIWPGQTGTMKITLKNLASVNYTVHIKNKGLIAPNKKAIVIDFEPVSINLPAYAETTVDVPFKVKSGAPIGVYEIVVAIYRGKDIDNALLITEIHLVGYVGGEPIQVRAVTLPSLWPGSSGIITLDIENIADIPYNISISLKDVTGPNGRSSHITLNEGVYLIKGKAYAQIDIPVTLSDNAPVGTYTISINIKRT